jgi:hypothetical protein
LELTVETMNDGRMVQISGTVHSPSAAGVTISLGGVVNTMAVTDSEGNFSVTVEASSLGTVTGSFTDYRGQTASASADVTDPAPSVSGLTAFQNSEGFWFICGDISDNTLAGTTIVFGGVLSGMTLVADSSGHFVSDGPVTVNPGDEVSVQAIDPWGTQSEVMIITV